MSDAMSPPVRGAWIETVASCYRLSAAPSPPVRGAWIETSMTDTLISALLVAPRAGGVD